MSQPSLHGSQDGLNRGGQGANGSDADAASQRARSNYQPGQPIGYLAARGTPYERKYFTRKLGVCCLFIAPIVIIITLVIALVPVLWAIGNHALHTSQFHVEASNITAPANTSFPLTLQAQVKKVGIFPASIQFREPINVYWNTPPPNMREVHLGSFNLGRINAAAGHAKVNQATFFNIADEEAFGIFSGYLVSQEEFTWAINSTNLHVEAFSFFPTFKPLNIQKHIVIKGINNFGNNIQLLDLQLPAADPEGGLQVITTTILNNPSPFGIQVGTLNLDLFYQGLYLGPVSVDGLNVTAGPNVVTLNGRVLPQAGNTTALNILGNLFTNYINSVPSEVFAVGRSVTQANGEKISWLTQGLQQLNAKVNFTPPEPINTIKGIEIKTINLEYSEDLPYNPVLSSNNLTGIFQLPFGFPLNITQLATSLTILTDGAVVGSASGPFAPSDTEINVMSQRQTAGNIDLTLPPSQLILPNTTDAAKEQLIQFQKMFVYTNGTDFQTQGSAKALTQTPVGEILLDGIKFDVGTGLKGLEGLTKYPTIINSVDVKGGNAQHLDLGVLLTVINPSNLNLSTGDTSLELLRENVVLGTTTLPDLILVPGRNDINATATFDPNVAPIGLDTLNRFISGMPTVLDANGFNASSQIVSLVPALQDLRLNTTLPPLEKSLVQSANLTVLSSTGVTDDVANSIVYLDNPFSSDLTITRISTNASARGIFLANIDTPLQFSANGNGVTASPNIPLALNLFPPDLFAVLRAFAIESGQKPEYIDGLVQLAGFTLSPTSNVNTPAASKRDIEQETFTFEEDSAAVEAQMAALPNPGVYYDIADGEYDSVAEDGAAVTKRALPLTEDNQIGKRDNLYTGFNLQDYVGKAFSVATADLVISADTTIGEYGSTLTFSQDNVPLGTDDTLFLLLPVLAKPIVQAIVDGSVLNIDRVTITEARPTSFTAQLQGSLTNAGPFDGTVTFPDGLEIYWQGRLLTQTAFPEIKLTGDLGASLNVELEGSISDVGFFTEFLKAAITDPAFVWDIRGSNIAVNAIGINVGGIALTKSVQLTGLNGLQGQVIINSFDLPSNSPQGGIALTAISTINNPAQVGVALSQFGVDISMGETMIGPSAAASAFTLQALAVTEVPLAGRIVEQTSQSGLSDLSTLFNRFVHNQNTDLVVQGVYAGPSDVVWLNEGIKVLRVNVVLPSQDFEVIRLISLNSLALYFTVPTAWNPRTDSSNTTANFFLPFAFPVDIKQIEGPFTANYQNTDMAVLNIPPSDVQTDVEARILTLAFSNIPFAVFDNAHRVFSQFSADFVAREQVTFNLHGSTNAQVATAAGQISLTDIDFSLNTNLLGLQGLNARPATVANLDVYRGYPTYLQINVDTTLFNPSDTTVGAGDVSFAVSFQDAIIGNAMIKDILLPPGSVVVPTEIQYMPVGAANLAAGQNLLENYVQNVTSETLVLGTSQTTPIESLKQALGQIQLKTEIPALGQLLVQRASLVIPKDIAQNGGVASTRVTLNNPFTASIYLLQLKAKANFEDLTIGTIDQDLEATNNVFYAPGKQVSTSNPIPITLDIRPKTLIMFILQAADAYGVNLGPLPEYFLKVLELEGDAETQVIPYPDDSTPPCNGGQAFDTLGTILKLIAPLQISIPIESTLKLDEYQTDLDFIQQPVPVDTDDSILYLVGPASAPLIQIIVDESELAVQFANATSLTNEGFTTSLIGALKVNAPADAYIEVPDGLTVEYKGKDIAKLTLPPLCSTVPDGIPNLDLTSQLTITDQGAFVDFTYDLLTNPSFEWRLYNTNATVRTLGIKFSNVNLSKTITLDAFNGLPGITITDFKTAGDGDKRINIVTETDIPSQASLGVELGQATFDLYFQGVEIGQASSKDLFLAYKATTSAVLTGYLKDQSGNSKNLATLGVLFTQYLAGENSTLTIRGNNVVGPASNGQPISWLTAAFKRFSTETVLPGKIYTIISAITLSDLEVYILDPENSYSIPATNQNTDATFANPLEFSLSVLSLKPSITIVFGGSDAASLTLPTIEARSGVSTGPNDPQTISFGFENQTVSAVDRGAFEDFFAAVTDTKLAQFGLNGTADTLTRTVIGDIPIARIPFSVQSELKGINSFDGQVDIIESSSDDPESGYLGVNVRIALENPSNITVHTSDVSLLSYATEINNVYVGRSFIPKLDLAPGRNEMPAQLRVEVTNNNTDVQESLRQYITSKDETTRNKDNPNVIPATIKGSLDQIGTLSPYPSLGKALAGSSVNGALRGIGEVLITEIRSYIPPSALAGFIIQEDLGLSATEYPVYIYAYIDFINGSPLGIAFNTLFSNIYKGGGGINDDNRYATLTESFSGFELPAAVRNNTPSVDRTTTPEIDNILLTKKVLETLPLLGSKLDVTNVVDTDVVNKDNGARYNLPGLPYVQKSVDTVYCVSVKGDICDINIPAGISTLEDLLGLLFSNPLGAAIFDTVFEIVQAFESTFTPGNARMRFAGAGGRVNPLANSVLCKIPAAKAILGEKCVVASSTTTNATSTATATATDSTALSSLPVTSTEAEAQSSSSSTKAAETEATPAAGASENNRQAAATSTPEASSSASTSA